MPLIKSLYDTSNPEKGIDDGIFVPFGKMVMLIADEIVRKKPSLVIGSGHDEKQNEILKREIIGIMDRDSYYYSGGRDKVIKGVFDFMFGYGILQKHIEDDDVTDIDGTSHDEFSITKKGVRIPVDVDFGDTESFGVYCRLIAVRNGGILNEDNTHCRVADLEKRLRINVSIPPRNISGPAVSIRKHRGKAYTIERLKELDMLDRHSAGILEDVAKSGDSVLFCGKGAAGKTTLLRTFLNLLPEMERVLVVESDAEIYPEKKFCIEQRTKRPSEGGSPVSLEMLIRDGLTMSLDTYCIGEIVGEEAYPFIRASCTGHRVLGTIHADSAKDAIPRLVSMALCGSRSESEKSLKTAAATGIDIVVHIKAFKVIEILKISQCDEGCARQHAIYERGAK